MCVMGSFKGDLQSRSANRGSEVFLWQQEEG